ncbi:unnamed protein product [Brachionus calyciflorus]|uniref:Uncharacterized protein n=1 Tax=Brachionus calyciflorus TaxID=104777 RepID=A0A813M276_9BILA|nr:unnamed protein product [Brachionus calyciflorus]
MKRSYTFLTLYFICSSLILFYIYKYLIDQQQNKGAYLCSIDKYVSQLDLINSNQCKASNLSVTYDKCIKVMKDLHHEFKIRFKDKQNCEQCLIINEQKQIIFYHTFLDVKENINASNSIFKTRLINLNLMSFLNTQNLQCSQLIYWITDRFPIELRHELELKYSKWFKNNSVQFRIFDLKKVCDDSLKSKLQYSILHTYPICQVKNQPNFGNSVTFSDFVRFIVLDVYAGIWIDLDVLYLKDMRLLWHKNFIYRWGSHMYVNTAVIGINKKIDHRINKVYDKMFLNTDNFDHIGAKSYANTFSDLVKSQTGNLFENGVFTVYHSFLFDPAWISTENGMRPFKNAINDFNQFIFGLVINRNDFDPNEFYPGAFLYHIHNSNRNVKIQENSYFYHFEIFLKNKLNL